MSLVPAVLVLVSAFERRKALLYTGVLYLIISFAWDGYWLYNPVAPNRATLYFILYTALLYNPVPANCATSQ